LRFKFLELGPNIDVTLAASLPFASAQVEPSTNKKGDTPMNHSTHRINFAAVVLLTAVALILTASAVAQPLSNGARLGTIIVQPLTGDELKWLLHMREEEKLARDVYKVLYEKWNLVVFQNIMASEENHFTAIGTLLTRYGVPDPALSSGGVYSDSTLNALYSQLLTKGMESAQAALEVGAAIEKVDIADLEEAIKAAAKLDIKRVYSNLMNASYNHLEAFETVCTLTVPSN
jgi:hypothetical protein